MTKIIGLANSCKECPNRHYFSGGAYECLLVRGCRLNADSSIPQWCPLADYAAPSSTQDDATGARMCQDAYEIGVQDGRAQQRAIECRPVAALASAPAQQWISVRDRLPAEGQPVMFVVASKYPDYNGRVFGGSFCMLADVPSFNTPGVGYRASHWMPLPEAPASSVASKEEPTS